MTLAYSANSCAVAAGRGRPAGAGARNLVVHRSVPRSVHRSPPAPVRGSWWASLALAGLLLGGAVQAGAANAPPSGPAAIRAADSVELERLRGSFVVVHFWATWCAPCLEEMPSLIAFYRDVYPALQEYGAGLRLLLVSQDARRKDLRRYLAERGWPFPVVFDPYGRWGQRLGFETVPGTVIVGPQGEVLRRKLGVHDWESASWRRTLRRLLEGS